MKALYVWSSGSLLFFCKNCGAKLQLEHRRLRHPRTIGWFHRPTFCLDAGKLFYMYEPVVELKEVI